MCVWCVHGASLFPSLLLYPPSSFWSDPPLYPIYYSVCSHTRGLWLPGEIQFAVSRGTGESEGSVQSTSLLKTCSMLMLRREQRRKRSIQMCSWCFCSSEPQQVKGRQMANVPIRGIIWDEVRWVIRDEAALENSRRLWAFGNPLGCPTLRWGESQGRCPIC